MFWLCCGVKTGTGAGVDSVGRVSSYARYLRHDGHIVIQVYALYELRSEDAQVILMDVPAGSSSDADPQLAGKHAQDLLTSYNDFDIMLGRFSHAFPPAPPPPPTPCGVLYVVTPLVGS